MGLLSKPRPTVSIDVQTINDALWWDRKGFFARLFQDAINQERAQYARAQHRRWKQAGRPRLASPQAQQQPRQKPAHMTMVSRMMGDR